LGPQSLLFCLNYFGDPQQLNYNKFGRTGNTTPMHKKMLITISFALTKEQYLHHHKIQLEKYPIAVKQNSFFRRSLVILISDGNILHIFLINIIAFILCNIMLLSCIYY